MFSVLHVCSWEAQSSPDAGSCVAGPSVRPWAAGYNWTIIPGGVSASSAAGLNAGMLLKRDHGPWVCLTMPGGIQCH